MYWKGVDRLRMYYVGQRGLATTEGRERIAAQPSPPNACRGPPLTWLHRVSMWHRFGFVACLRDKAASVQDVIRSESCVTGCRLT